MVRTTSPTRRRTRLIVLLAVLTIAATACRLEADDDGLERNLITKRDMTLEIQVSTLVDGDKFVRKELFGNGEYGTQIGGQEFTVVGCDTETCETRGGGSLRIEQCGEPQRACSLLYQPKEGFTGADTFRYRICHVENRGRYCDEADATIGVGDLELHASSNHLYGNGTSRDSLVWDDRLYVGGLRTIVPINVTRFSVDTKTALGGTVTYDPKNGDIFYTPPKPRPGDAARSINDQFGYEVCHAGNAFEGSPCGRATVTASAYLVSGPPVARATTTTTSTTMPPAPTTSTSAPGPIDDDGDGVANDDDNCPTTANADQLNTDNQADGGDACDSDDDDDTFLDGADNCPVWPNLQSDNDSDGMGDDCDADDDNDLIVDTDDNCPLDSNPLQEDADDNDIGDVCDFGGGGGGILTQITAAGDQWLEQPFVQAIAYGITFDQVDFEITNDDAYDHDFWIDLDTSGTVNAGDVFETIAASDVTTFTATLTAGSYQFTCNLHPGMDGTLTVM